MEANQDASEQCIHLAKQLMVQGIYDKALKYLLKSEKLYPTATAKNLMEECTRKINGANQPSGSTSDNDASDLRNRKGSHNNNQSKKDTNGWSRQASREEKENAGPSTKDSAHQRSSSGSRADYTEEQLEAVKRIRKCKDYYEVLGLAKDASDADLKKAYRKLALLLHPDKNKAPGATEAFKAVGNAFAVLSNPQKRKDYDLYGSEEQQQEQMRQRRQQQRGFYDDDGHYYDYSRGFEGEFTPEEIFNMFFGGGFPTGGVYRREFRRPRHHANHAHHEASGYSVLLQMAPVLVLLGLSLMSSFFSSEPAYSLARTSKYTFERKTTNLEIPYFVRENFEKDYKGSIARVEAQVEEDYLTSLRGQCFRERNYKESMIWRARSFRDRDLEEKAKSIKTPSCDHLADLSKQYVIW